jgi:hypothetical protein
LFDIGEKRQKYQFLREKSRLARKLLIQVQCASSTRRQNGGTIMKRVLTTLGVLAVFTSAFASWNVTIVNSSGVLNPPSTPVSVPTIVQSNPVPQITFLTAAATPHPLIVGMGTGYTVGSFFGQYTINDPTNSLPPLNGFNFVIAGYVNDWGRITWFKKVVRNSDNAILWQASGTIYGGNYAGGVERRVQYRNTRHTLHARQRCDRLRDLPTGRHYRQHLFGSADAGRAGLDRRA